MCVDSETTNGQKVHKPNRFRQVVILEAYMSDHMPLGDLRNMGDHMRSSKAEDCGRTFPRRSQLETLMLHAVL